MIIGDYVVLNSGGPPMRVVKFAFNPPVFNIVCEWCDSYGVLHSAEFDIRTVRAYEGEPTLMPDNRPTGVLS